MNKVESPEQLLVYQLTHLGPLGPGEVLLWRRKDGKVFRHFGNEGDRLPNGDFVDVKDTIQYFKEITGSNVHVTYGPGMIIQRNERGQIRSCDPLGRERPGIWVEMVTTSDGEWDIRRFT